MDAAERDELFRDFGIDVENITQPEYRRIRAEFSLLTIIGQWAGTVVMSSIGLGMAYVFFFVPWPVNLPIMLLVLAGTACLIYFATRNDYSWVELEDNVIRARHMYTGRLIERTVDEIKELVPRVILGHSASAQIASAWMGRIRMMEIRFQDGKAPFQICRSDPAMSNAREFMVALVYQMSQHGEVATEVTTLDGRPLLKRICWKQLSGDER